MKDLEDNKEESGWKLVHGDVFRPPTSYPMLYSVCVGKHITPKRTQYAVHQIPYTIHYTSYTYIYTIPFPHYPKARACS
ncbi:hypothetical protein EON63_10975 [archaeon]|nr:MAG: hypothetical protein EON63_10975 [archaeon]